MTLLKGSRSMVKLTRYPEGLKGPAANVPSSDHVPSVSSPKAVSHSAGDDRMIKSLLKSYKRLEVTLSKFDGKQAGIAKTNLLRTVVLPFLRSSPALHTTFDRHSKIYASFASISTTVLGRWWRSLLAGLAATGSSQVSATDRSAYLECMSRILARKEWLYADQNATQCYTRLLTDTLDFALVRLLAFKVVPVAVAAFVGKVFAHSFFYLPGVSNALLFLLNVKQRTLDRSAPALPNPSPAAVRHAVAVFPGHVTHLVNYNGISKLERAKRGAINCVAPPKHPVEGIRDPAGPWVRRWCASDSDIFNSFFRHYLSLTHAFVGDDIAVSGVTAFPGFRVIASFIYQILSVSVNRISLHQASASAGHNGKSGLSTGNVNNSHSASGPPVTPISQSHLTPQSMSSPPSGLPRGASPAPSFKQADSNYTAITKLFRSIRDTSYSTLPFSCQVTRIVDALLVRVARHIAVYDTHRTSLVLHLVYEYSLHVCDPADMDWNFWLDCCYRTLTSTHHVQLVTRTFAFLFNVWARIPTLLPESDTMKVPDWLSDRSESLKANFSIWLTSGQTWRIFFTHWNPLVRSHYLRLLVWRVVGANKFESACAVHATRRIRLKIDFIFESLCEALGQESAMDRLSFLDFSCDSPIVNRRFGIMPIGSRYSYLDEVTALSAVSISTKPSDLRKTHPYEILDEAVYTCTSLPSSPAGSQANTPELTSDSSFSQKSGQNHSLIDSLSRFFKSLSTENSSGIDALVMAPPQRISDGSLSSQAVNDSSNEHSTESSVTSDSDSFVSDRAASSSASTYSAQSAPHQPPELVQIPPEIVRPLFKLDIVLDQEIAGQKYTKMQESRTSGNVFYGSQGPGNTAYRTLPKPPKVPSVSVFSNSDNYTRFFITRDTYQVDEDVVSLEDMEDLGSFREKTEARLLSTTDLVTLGKALNEWNRVVDEFESYLFAKVEADHAHYISVPSGEGGADAPPACELNEAEYLARIIPLLPIDNLTESKLLNAA